MRRCETVVATAATVAAVAAAVAVVGRCLRRCCSNSAARAWSSFENRTLAPANCLGLLQTFLIALCEIVSHHAGLRAVAAVVLVVVVVAESREN
jgi:hypothetical protein